MTGILWIADSAPRDTGGRVSLERNPSFPHGLPPHGNRTFGLF